MAVYTIGSDGEVIEINDTEKLKSLSNVNISKEQLPIEDKNALDWTLSSAANSSKITKVQDKLITNNTHGNAIDKGEDNSDQVAYKNYNSPFGDPNVLSKSDNFAARYQLDGLQGLNTFNALREGDIANTADFVILYFNLIGRMLLLNSILNIVLNVSTRIPENAKNFLGSYKNKNVDYIAKYLSERYNYPVDLYKKEGNFFYSAFGALENEKSTIMTTNVAFLLGLNEFLFPGNGISKDLDNYIQNKVPPSSVNNFYNFANALLTAGIEYLSAEEEAKNRIKLLMRKLEMSYDFNYSLNEMEKNNFDPIVKLLFENVFDNYAFKFLIERINVGLKLYENKHFLKQLNGDIGKHDDISYLTTTGINPDSLEPTSYGKKFEYREKFLLGQKINDKIPTTISFTKSALLFHKSAEVYGNIDIIRNDKFFPSDYNRIPRESVERIEKIIDSDYMPFSIHDLRTNEVIGLNAFIESYSDSFSAQYNESGGFGRVDKVMKWESTTRSISINFYIIATNEDDHDMMWYQINKLVTMLYPQWSAPSGAVYYSDKDQKLKGYEAFRYPFTQVPTASPLVRIRLGDILTTNYSDINIKRIHGYGDRSKLEDAGTEFYTDKEISEDFTHYTYRLKDETYTIIVRDNNKEEIGSALITGDKLFADDNIALGYKIVTTYDDHSTYHKQRQYSVKVYNDKNEEIHSDKNIIIVAKSTDFIEREKNEVPLDLTSKDKGDKLNNPIIAGFETTMGKGLAGMISSLSVDFSGELPWEIKKGSRAPIYTKITMQFKPIHDIAPGLDHNGMMRAPVYRVGNIVRGLS